MKRETIRVGSMVAYASIEDGQLMEVDLPDTPPADLDAPMLRGMLEQLSQWPVAKSERDTFTAVVRRRMQQIPPGEAMTYSELAADVGNPRGMRAVGQACARNPLLLVVPCHRVLGEDGLGGYRLGLEWKRKLLELESEFAELER